MDYLTKKYPFIMTDWMSPITDTNLNDETC